MSVKKLCSLCVGSLGLTRKQQLFTQYFSVHMKPRIQQGVLYVCIAIGCLGVSETGRFLSFSFKSASLSPELCIYIYIYIYPYNPYDKLSNINNLC